MDWIWVKSLQNAIVFLLSLMAFIFSMRFYNLTQSVILPEAPKATQDLQKVFLPPIYRMQYFVLVFDSICVLYYLYQMPFWDGIKSKFPFFQYEAKTAEKADCTNLLLTIMFNSISKVSPFPPPPCSVSPIRLSCGAYRAWPSLSSW